MTKTQATYGRKLLLVMLIVLTVLGGTGPRPTAQAQDPGSAYQRALDRIQAAKESGATELDLSGMRLAELPPEIGQLANLQELYLSENVLTSLPPELWQLTNLRVLDLSGNALTSLPPEVGQLTHSHPGMS